MGMREPKVNPDERGSGSLCPRSAVLCSNLARSSFTPQINHNELPRKQTRVGLKWTEQLQPRAEGFLQGEGKG